MTELGLLRSLMRYAAADFARLLAEEKLLAELDTMTLECLIHTQAASPLARLLRTGYSPKCENREIFVHNLATALPTPFNQNDTQIKK